MAFYYSLLLFNCLIIPKISFILKKYFSAFVNGILLLCLYTGIRICEVLALNYNEDIDLDNKMIKVTKTLTKDRNKNTIIGPTKTKSGKKKYRNKWTYRRYYNRFIK